MQFKTELRLIEDASQAFESRNKNIKACELGDIAVISFHENKQFTTGGEGGVIVTDDEIFYNYAKSIRDQGRVTGDNWQKEMLLGYNYRITELQSLFGLAQLSRFEFIINRRQKIAERYIKILMIKV